MPPLETFLQVPPRALSAAPLPSTLDRDCICCSARDWASLYHDVVVCRKCGYQRMSSEASDADLAAIYHGGYFAGEKYHDYVADKTMIQTNLAARLATVQRLLKPRSCRDLDLLEVGCAYGFFLEVARPEFGGVRGVDISRDATDHARDVLGLDVTTGDLRDLAFPPESFDVVCMWDTIEHIGPVEEYIPRVWALLRPGGLFFTTTGDAGSLVPGLQKRKWRLYDPPQHVHYFTRHSLGLLLERVGFRIVHQGTCGFLHSVEQVVHGLAFHDSGHDGVLGRLSRWLHPRTPAVLGRIRFPIDLRDIMMMVGEKPAPQAAVDR